MVTYEVHPVRGYEAKVSYEGTAQVELNLKYEKNDKCAAFKKNDKNTCSAVPGQPRLCALSLRPARAGEARRAQVQTPE